MLAKPYSKLAMQLAVAHKHLNLQMELSTN